MKDVSPNLTVIIVTFNGERWIRKCLESVHESTVIPNIVVVDNASTDSTVEIVERDFSQVELIKLNKNVGFGQANNIGIYHALKSGANYIFLVNQDTYLDEKCVEILLKASGGMPDYGILSPVHLTYDGTDLNPSFAKYLTKSDSSIFFNFFLDKSASVLDVEFVAAAFWLLPRKTLEEVGGFDPVYFLYGEDDDLASRIRAAGYKVGVVTDAKAYHHHTNSSRTHDERIDLERALFHELIEILKRPGVSSLYAWLRLWRRVFGHAISRLAFGFGTPMGVLTAAVAQVWKKRGMAKLSKRSIGEFRRFLTPEYINEILSPMIDSDNLLGLDKPEGPTS